MFYKQRYERVPLICGAVILAFVIRGLATYGQSVTLAKIGNNLVARYQKRIFDHLLRLGVGFFNDTRSGRLAARINENVNGIRDLLGMTLKSVAGDAVSLIGLIAVMIMQDPLLSASALLIGPPLVLTVNYLMRRLRRITRETVEINSHLIGAMQEATQGISIVKAFTMEGQLSAKIAELGGPCRIARQQNRPRVGTADPDCRSAGRFCGRRGDRLCGLPRGNRPTAAWQCFRFHHGLASCL